MEKKIGVDVEWAIDGIDNNIYIIVPFERKEEAKKLKARWNPNAKKWYTVPSNKNNEELFKLFPKFIS